MFLYIVQYTALLYCTLYNTLHCCTVHCTIHCNGALIPGLIEMSEVRTLSITSFDTGIALYCTTLHCNALSCTPMNYSENYTTMHCTEMQYANIFALPVYNNNALRHTTLPYTEQYFTSFDTANQGSIPPIPHPTAPTLDPTTAHAMAWRKTFDECFSFLSFID